MSAQVLCGLQVVWRWLPRLEWPTPRGAEYSQGARGVLLPRFEFGVLLMHPAALVSGGPLLELVSAPLSLHVGQVSYLQPAGVSLLQVVLFFQMLPT